MIDRQSPVVAARRIGLLVPSCNTVLEADIYLHVPRGWTVHTARMYSEDASVEADYRMLDEFTLPAARCVASTRPHVVIFGCTSAGAVRGNEYERALMMEISAITGVPTVSVMQSVREALKDLNAKGIVVVTPYVEALNAPIRASLEASGMEVLRIEGLGIRGGFEIAEVPAEAIIDLAHKAVEKLTPDALFVSCTNLPAMRVLPALRREFPFPVITSNSAALERAVSIAQQSLDS